MSTEEAMDVEECAGETRAPRVAMETRPNQTIYVRNLNEKVQKQELRKSLFAAFSRYGRVLDVVALKTLKMRGQAFIVFEDVPSATTAMRAMQGFEFYGKPMVVQYARAKSDKIAKMDGTYAPREKRPKPAAVTELKESGEDPDAGQAKKIKDADSSGPAATPAAVKVDDTVPPNRILFVQNLPPGSNATDISELFKPFAGFLEVRAVPGNAGIAFVEFTSEAEATVARTALQGFKYLNYAMAISYAKQ